MDVLKLKKMRFKRSFLLLFTFAILLFSCSKIMDDLDFNKFAQIDWSPEYAIPLVYSEFAIKDFFSEENQKFIKTDDNGLISLVYQSKNLSSDRAEGYFFLDDRHFEHTFPLLIFPSVNPDTITMEFSFTFYSSSESKRIDSVFFKAGAFSIFGKTNLNKEKASMKLTSPDIINVQTNDQLSIDLVLDNPGGQQDWVNFSANESLKDYKLSIDPLLSGGKNRIRVISQLVIQPDSNPDLSPYEIEINGDMTNMEYLDFYGHIGYYDFNLVDTVEISVFNNSLGGAVGFGHDALLFVVETYNEVGVPITIEAQTLQVYSPFTAPYYKDIYLFGQSQPNMFEILSPTPAEIGKSVYTRLDFSNTNFPEVFLSMAPRKLYYDFKANINLSGDTTLQNVLQDTSKLRFQTTLELKLYFEIAKLSIQDTVDFEMSTATLSTIDYLICRVNAYNGFPLNAGLQIYFTDSKYNILDSLIYDNDIRIIEGGKVGLPPKLKVEKPSHKTTDIVLYDSRLERIINAEKLIIKAELSTTNGDLAKIYDDYAFKIKVGAKTGINL